jgi:hypothetical protein
MRPHGAAARRDRQVTSGQIVVKTMCERLALDRKTHRLLSLRSHAAPGQEFIASAPEHPVFAIQYLDRERQYRQLTSLEATAVSSRVERKDGVTTLTAEFRRIGGLDLDVTTAVRASPAEPLSRWKVAVRNGAGIEIVDVQYPFVVCRYGLGGKAGSEKLLLPHFYGQLIPAPSMAGLGPDCPPAWQLNRENGSFSHYPGGQFAQFLAYYNDRAGLYLACEDPEGNVKRFRALHREPGMRLGVAHIGDWPRRGERRLEYDTVLGSFTGDWYAAAGMYREWSLRQKWATPLHRRTDVPAWLLESPPYITIRPQGVLDAGPVFPVKEFLPYEKCIPLLARIARRVKSSLVAVIMAWERGGSWVYPDCFPPVGGEKSLKRFAAEACRRGWRLGSFCNGTRWVVGHNWNGYDGRDYYRKHHGDRGVCRLPDGSAWAETWDAGWRPSYDCCSGAKATRQIAADFVQRLIGWGLESIQFFDQNCGAATFPCFAKDHEHPPAPGKWMARKMAEMVAAFRRAARAAGEDQVIQSVEMCCNEYCLPLFQESDSRLRPPGHHSGANIVPVYQFLFHECIVMHGGMGHAPEPYHLQIRNANNGVMGEIPGGVLTGDGTLLAKDTENWAEWEPRVGSDAEALEMIRVVTAMRRGAGRDFLVYGRMMAPAAVRGVRTVRWKHQGRRHRIPAVFHCAWQAPDARFGIALANWTNQTQRVSVADRRLGQELTEHVVGRRTAARHVRCDRGRLALVLPPLSMVLVSEKE